MYDAGKRRVLLLGGAGSYEVPHPFTGWTVQSCSLVAVTKEIIQNKKQASDSPVVSFLV